MRTVSRLGKLGIWLLQLLVATLAVPVATALLYYSFKPVLLIFTSDSFVRTDAILSLRLFPFQAMVAFGCAWRLARNDENLGADPVTRFVWIAPLIWWLFLIAVRQHQLVPGETRWQHFLWSRSADALRIQIISTMPLITALAYALGNYWGNRRRRPSCGTDGDQE